MATEQTAGTVGVAGGSRVRLRRLCERPDGDGWVIGRIETGDFITVPEVAHRIIALLGEGRAVDDVAAILRAETGTSFGVADFVAALDELGFVAMVDELARPDKAPLRASLPWLRPAHVRWLMHPLAPVMVAGFAVAAVVVLALHPALLPSYRVLVWSKHAGIVLAVNAAIAWTLILVHELAHLATARAAGVPARITLSTRLQFLTAQTDVSGVWAATRRTRMTVYLAGMSADICAAGIFLIVLWLGDPHGLASHLLAVAAAEALLGLLIQFLVFMRTDIYFVFQDITRCANLYADGSAYLRYLFGRVTRPVRHADDPDPSEEYQLPQRRAIRLYSAVLLGGTAICLGVEFAVSLPALITLVARAVSETGTTLTGTLDGGAALAVLLGFQILWVSRWWHRHGHQVRSITRRQPRTGEEVEGHARHPRGRTRPAHGNSQGQGQGHAADRHPQTRPA